MSEGQLSGATANTPMNVKGALEDVLADSLVDDSFVDVAFYAYSKRDRAGKVYGMKRVLANSAILQASSSYLRGLLAGRLAESNEGVDAEKALTNAHTDCFEYEADSDLEDEDESKEKENLKFPLTPSSARSESTISVTSIDSDMRLSVESGKEWVSPSHPRRYKIVPMRSVAASTLKSLVYYIYTGQVHFLPLTSSGTKEKEKAVAEHFCKHPNRPICSSKSMYRLADEIGFADLKTEARKHLFAHLSGDNILDEIFSVFSSKYPEILEEQVSILWGHSSSGSLDAMLARKIDSVVKGQMTYAAAAVLALICQRRCPSPAQHSKPLAPLSSPPRSALVASAPATSMAPQAAPSPKPEASSTSEGAGEFDKWSARIKGKYKGGSSSSSSKSYSNKTTAETESPAQEK